MSKKDEVFRLIFFNTTLNILLLYKRYAMTPLMINSCAIKTDIRWSNVAKEVNLRRFFSYICQC